MGLSSRGIFDPTCSVKEMDQLIRRNKISECIKELYCRLEFLESLKTCWEGTDPSHLYSICNLTKTLVKLMSC